MALLDRFRVVNYTRYARTGMVTTVAHIKKGMLPARANPIELAVIDTVTAQITRCQWMPMGPRYDDGSYRTILCNFNATMPAGNAGENGYAFHSEREYRLGDTNIPDFVPHVAHPDVAAAFQGQGDPAFQFQYGIEGQTIDLAEDGIWQRSTEFEPDFVPGYGAAINVKWQSQRRLYLPGGTAPNAEPSFVCNIEYEIPHNQPYVHFTTFCANSLFTSDDPDERFRENPAFQLTQPITLSIQGPDCHLDSEWFWLPPAQNRVTRANLGDGRDTRMTLIDFRDISAGNVNRRRSFPDGQMVMRRGTLVWGNSDSAMAERESRLEASSHNARENDQFGVFKYVPQSFPSTGSISTSSRYEAACRWERDRLTYYTHARVLGDHYANPKDGQVAWPRTTGAHPDHGALKGIHNVGAACPDMECYRISNTIQAGTRPVWFFDRQGRLMDVFGPDFKDPNAPFMKSTYLPYFARPWFGDSSGKSNYQQMHWLGKTVTLSDTSTPRAFHGGDANAPGFNWYTWDVEHQTHNSALTLTLMHGDTFFRRYYWPNVEQINLSRYRSPAEEAFLEARIGNYRTIWGDDDSRGAARTMQTLVSAYAVNGNQRVMDAIAERFNTWIKRGDSWNTWPNKPIRIYGINGVASTDGRRIAPAQIYGDTYVAKGIAPWMQQTHSRAMWGARLWLKENNNPTEDPYFTRREPDILPTPGARPPQSYLDAIEVANTMIKAIIVTCVKHIGFVASDGSYWTTFHMTAQPGLDKSSIMDEVPVAQRTNARNHPFKGPWNGLTDFSFGTWPFGQSADAWRQSPVIAWLLGSELNDIELLQLAVDFQDHVRGDGTDMGWRYGWGGNGGADPYGRVALARDPYEEYTLSNVRVNIRGRAAAQIAATASMAVAEYRYSVGLNINPKACGSPALDDEIAHSLSLDFAPFAFGTPGIFAGEAQYALSASIFPKACGRARILGGPNGDKDLTPISGFVFVGGRQAISANIYFGFATLARYAPFFANAQDRGILHWNHSTLAAEEFEVTRSGGTAAGNCNTHPIWNAGSDASFVGPESKLFLDLRNWFGRDIATMKLAVPGLTTGGATRDIKIVRAEPGQAANTLAIQLDSPHPFRVNHRRPVYVSLSGLQDVIPEVVEGQEYAASATDSSVVLEVSIGAPPSSTYVGSDPEVKCSIRGPSLRRSDQTAWDDLNEAFDCWRDDLRSSYARDLDSSAVFVLLGEDDAEIGRTEDQYFEQLTQMVEDIRSACETSSHGPKLPIVMGRLIKHSGQHGEFLAAVEAFRAAQARLAGADASLALIDLDDIPERMDLQVNWIELTGQEVIDVAERLYAGFIASGLVSNARTLPEPLDTALALGAQISDINGQPTSGVLSETADSPLVSGTAPSSVPASETEVL